MRRSPLPDIDPIPSRSSLVLATLEAAGSADIDIR